MNGSITAHCASDNQNRTAISNLQPTAGVTESDSLSLRNTLIEFGPYAISKNPSGADP
jgi:hypothetical protein